MKSDWKLKPKIIELVRYIDRKGLFYRLPVIIKQLKAYKFMSLHIKILVVRGFEISYRQFTDMVLLYGRIIENQTVFFCMYYLSIVAAAIFRKFGLTEIV